MREKKLEVLAPAGNLETFKSVIDAGADAVYFGGEQFGARAYADNFSLDDAGQAIRYGHLRGKKAYLTINTLLKNQEMEKKLYPYTKAYVEMGIDAVIVQDLGVFSFIRQYFPDLDIHASTQMTIVSARGAAFMKELGASRVVTAREMSLEEIAQIRQRTDIEIETFVHGALCMGYSGQCLMSSMLGARSGNRGRCAQPCRLPYQLLDGKKQPLSSKGRYLLSLKDLCSLEDLYALADAGVFSFKIEGRMKQKEYAAGVVSVYRRYADAYLEGKRPPVTPKDRQILLDLGNRNGFTDVYFHQQNDKSMLTLSSPSHEKKSMDPIGKNSDPMVQKKVGIREVAGLIPLEGDFYASLGKPMELILHAGHQTVCTTGGEPAPASRQATAEPVVRQKLEQTGNTPFCFRELRIHMADGIFVPMPQIKELRRRALEDLEKSLGRESGPGRILPFTALPETPKASGKSASEFFALCQTAEQVEQVLRFPWIDMVGVSWGLMEQLQDIAKKVKLCLVMPPIFRSRMQDRYLTIGEKLSEEQIAAVLACDYDELEFLQEIGVPKDKIILDHRLYTLSNRSQAAFDQLGYHKNCVPLELNHRELAHRDNQNSYMTIYGRQVLMITASCQKAYCRGCDKKEEILYLQDRYKEQFPVKNNCFGCYNEIYNSRNYQLITEKDILQTLGFGGYRLDFSLETASQVRQVLNDVQSVFLSTENDRDLAKQYSTFTKGHFKRGVE
jgi:putative protease